MSEGISERVWPATTYHLTMEQIGERSPVCPQCREPLVAREKNRRFMEDNRYVQCINGHIFALADPLEYDALVDDK